MYRIAILGLGHIGKKHVEVLKANPNFKIVALADNQAQAEWTKTIDVPFFKSLEDLLGSEIEVDIISVCTPNGLHAKQCIQIVEANRDIVCEKPLALNGKEAALIAIAAQKFKKNVFVVMQLRFSPVLQWFKAQIELQKLGKVILVQTNCFWNRDERYYLPNGKKHSWRGDKQLDGGVLFTQFSHIIDALYYCFGDFKIQSQNNFNINHTYLELPDTGNLVLAFKKHACSSVLHYTTAAWQKNVETSILVLGTAGTIKISGQYLDKIDFAEGEDLTDCPLNNNQNGHQLFYQNVVDVLKNQQQPMVTLKEAVRTIEILAKTS